MRDKVIFVSTANSCRGGGVFEVIYQLGKSLYRKGLNLEITWHDDEDARKDRKYYEDIPLLEYTQSYKYPLSVIGYSSDLLQELRKANPSILHTHGLWMYNSYVVKECKKHNSKLKTIIMPHGMLDPWAIKNSKWKKIVAGWLFENENLRTADCIQALNKSEYESIRKYGLNNPVAIIPNGISVPESIKYNRGKEKKTLLFIGRIHPKKGIAELLKALKILKLKNRFVLERWKIRIAGWDQLGHTDYLINKCKELDLNDYVEFIGPVFGEKKEYELCAADAYVLTSFSEGLPMSVLEAWAYELPVVMSEQCNLPDGFEYGAAIKVTPEPEMIAEGLERMFTMSNEERTAMGLNGLELVRREYTWDRIAEKQIKLYKWLLNGGDKPEFVELS